MDEVTKLVEFDLFNPEKLVQRFYNPKFNFLSWIRGRSDRHMTLNIDQEASVFKDLKTWAAIALMLSLFLLTIAALMRVESLREKCK